MNQRENDAPAGEQLPTLRTDEVTVDLGTMQAITKAELDQQIQFAKQYPRSLTGFQRDCRSMATLSQSVAKECFYALPRDGKIIDGPSVRLAEIVVSAWGNCRVGARIIEEGRDFIVAQGVFHDMQRGTVISTEVRRRIVNKYGERYKPDMIGVTANAACSIAMRNATFRGVPKALWNDIFIECKKVVAGDAKTLAARRKDALDTLSKMGATNAMVFEALGVKGIEDVGLDELVTLGGFASAIKEGEFTVEEIFAKAKGDSPAPTTRTEQAKQALGGKPAEPIYDEATARNAIKNSGDLDALDKTWRTIVADYQATGRNLPIELEAARNDRRSAIESEQ